MNSLNIDGVVIEDFKVIDNEEDGVRDMKEYRCLSVKQPWAELIARGEKAIELRTWRTDYRGPLAIVASLRRADTAYANIDGARGRVVCIVGLCDVRPATREDTGAAWSPVKVGEFAWVINGVIRVQGPELRGRLGLYRARFELS